MKLYNSISRQKENFQPRHKNRVNMYVCGITAYDYCHIGHARAAVVFDVLVRFLRYLGYTVNFVRNFTDIDDKIINKAHKEGLSSEEIAQKYIQAYYEDMQALQVLPADLEPKATEHIQEMQDLVQDLLQKGFAYISSSGDVYFRIRAFSDYGGLSGRDIDDLKSGIRIDPGEEKEDPLDFALWKKAKPGEPSWPSPWGKGRPGWHIECSAMSAKYLELPLDIHGGGQDLIFPHHENERAQTMASTGKEFVKYWVHNGFVQVKHEKMSKSLGNFVTIRDIIQDYHPETLRFFLLSKHYRSPLDFSWEGMQEAEKGLKRLYRTKEQLQTAAANKKATNNALPREIIDEYKEAGNKWIECLKDDLNTAAALGQIFTLARLANRILEDKNLRKTKQAATILQESLEMFADLSKALGILGRECSEFLAELRQIQARRLNINTNEVEDLLQQRDAARKTKDFTQADAIRDKLKSMGIEIKDTPAGSVWDIE